MALPVFDVLGKEDVSEPAGDDREWFYFVEEFPNLYSGVHFSTNVNKNPMLSDIFDKSTDRISDLNIRKFPNLSVDNIMDLIWVHPRVTC
jgi:hypothetical protein